MKAELTLAELAGTIRFSIARGLIGGPPKESGRGAVYTAD
jgi:hypothetical protein